MPKIDNKFTAFFLDTTTAPGTPITGLSATINIRETNGNLVVNNEPLTELGGGHYIYTFTGYDVYLDYIYDINPNSVTAFIESGVTTDGSLNKALAEINGGFAGFYVNYEAINSHTTRKAKEIRDEIGKIEKPIDIKPLLKEVCDDIALAKEEIIDNIGEINFEENEAKKLIKQVQGVDKKLSGYIKSIETDKSKIQEIAREFTRLELEDELKSKKYEKSIEEQIEEEFIKLDEEEKEEKKQELKEELREVQKEAKEIKKELNSL